MATQQEVLSLIIQTSGDDQLAATAKQLYAIGQGSDESAPKAQALLEELGRLAQVSSQASGLPALKAQLQSVGDQLFVAQQRVTDLSATIAASEAPTAAQTRALQKAQQASSALELQETQLAVAIKTSENALAAAGVSTENLDAADRQLQGSLAATRAEAVSLAAAHREAAAAEETQAATMTEVAERSAVLRAGFEQLKALLGTFAGILAFEQIKTDVGEILDTGNKFEQWGIQFKNAFGGAAEGEAALAKVKEIADATPLSLDQVTAAALQAKKEGLDPFDGSLQAIIDTSTKFGGGAEQVNELITALGKSANQGGLNIRTLTTLEQQGIPAAQLLGNALGKTAEQITELARNGKLGSDSVATLIQQLGKTSDDGLADEMGLLSTQVTKAKDNYDEFLDLIAKSGVYDAVVAQLKTLNAELKQGLENGSLQASAKAISDGLIAIGQAFLSVTKFATEHAGAIITVAEQYALFKGALLAVDLIGAAQKFGTLTAATLASGAAAEASAVGGFGKLRGAINALPTNLKIPIAVVGVTDAIVETTKLVETLIDIKHANDDLAKQRTDEAQQQSELLALANQVAQKTAAAANVQIASASQLAEKNRDQSANYVTALQNAIRYYEALKVQDRAIGDSDGAQAASDKVKALSIALQDATKHYGEVNTAVTKSTDLAASASARFYDLNLHALSAAQAVAGVFDGIKFNTLDDKGIGNVLAIIDSIRTHSKDAGAAVQGELAEALSKLNAEDLTEFQANVSKKLLEAKGNADDLKIAVGASLQAEMEKLGLSAEQAGAQFTSAGREIVRAFTGVATSAAATGQQIQLSFAQALTKVTTSAEVQGLQQQLQNAFAAGKISADQFGAAMEAAGRKSADIQTAAVAAGASLDGMGTQGTTAAQNISNALQDARDRLVVQADQMAKAITIALQHDGDAEALKAQLKGVEAQIASLNAQIATTGNSAPPSLNKVAQSTTQIATAAGNANTQVTEATENAEKGFTEWGDAADAASLATQKITADTAHANDGMQALAQGIADARSEFLAISDAAAKFYDTTLLESFNAGHTDDGSGFDRVARAMQSALDATTAKVAAEREQLANEVAVINQLGTSSNQAFGSFGDDATEASAKMEGLADLIKQGKYQTDLLGQADLQPLEQALEAAAQRAQQLAEQTKQAVDSFNDLTQSAQDALDEEEGNQDDLEDRRHQKQLDDLKAAAQAAGKLNTQQYLDAVAAENKLHALKMKDIADQQAAQNGTGSTNGTGSSTGAPSAPSGGGIVPTRYVQHSFALPTGKVSALVPENQSDQFEGFVRQLAAAKANSILG